MKSLMRVFIRFSLGAAAALCTLLLINAVLLFVWAVSTSSPRVPARQALQTISAALHKSGTGYTLDRAGAEACDGSYEWAMLLDEDGSVVWSRSLPGDLPRRYSLTDVAGFTRWYLEDYPVRVWEHPDGLLVAAGARGSVWKYSMEQPLAFLDDLPQSAGLDALTENRVCTLPENGVTGELAGLLNRPSAELCRRGEALQRRDEARAEWIAGVSHDIRTPLSMVLGYANELEESDTLPREARDLAGVIRRQAERIKRLVNDLNLAARLEYAMQPLRMETVRPVEAARRAAADFLNGGMGEEFRLSFREDGPAAACVVRGDEALLRRAVSNLIQNSVTHNPNGCFILVRVGVRAGGALSDEGAFGRRHGLGLLIVGQIARTHSGTLDLAPADPHGLRVVMRLPIASDGQEKFS